LAFQTSASHSDPSLESSCLSLETHLIFKSENWLRSPHRLVF